MCRLAAYLGPSIPLKPFLLDPVHSLLTQASGPQEMTYDKLNADGHGFGWFADDAMPTTYTQGEAIWTDANLPRLARALHSDGERAFTTRHAINYARPSLYYITDDESFHCAQIVASERPTASDYWQTGPEHHLHIHDPQEPAEFLAL